MSEGELFDALPETPPPAEVVPETITEEEPVPAAAPAAEAQPETPPVAEVRTPPAPVRGTRALPRDAGGLGATLAALRRQCGMELDDVAGHTRIKLNYLEALERENLSDMPQTVYVLAYVKKLCELYGVSREETDELVSGLRDHLSYEIPEDIDKSVICREQDEETHRKLRNLTAALIAGASLLLVCLILGGAVLLLRLRRSGNPPEPAAIPALDESRLLSLHEKPELKVSRLPK